MEAGDEVPAIWKDDVREVLLGSADISARVRQLGKEISAAYGGLNPVMLPVLKGSYIFAADLSRSLEIPHEIQFLRARSYVGTESSGDVSISGLEGVDLRERHVIVVEDIVDTGLTLKCILKKIRALGAIDVRSCTLLQKDTNRRRSDVPPVDYIAFHVQDEFVVGYGLDYNQRFRHLPFIGILKPHA